MVEFYEDLKRFGGRRALIRSDHRRTVQDFKARQRDLALAGSWFLILSLMPTGIWFVLAALGIVLFTTAKDEAKRMKACGRYWRCKRSMEVLGI